MGNVKFSKIMTPRCSKCGQRKFYGNDASGCPNMVGFEQNDGSVINLCNNCLKRLGSLDKDGQDAFMEDLM